MSENISESQLQETTAVGKRRDRSYVARRVSQDDLHAEIELNMVVKVKFRATVVWFTMGHS